MSISHNNTICSAAWSVEESGSGFHRLYYVYGGTAGFKSQQEQYALEQGYLYLFPARTPYEMWHDPDDPLRCLWFHIVPSAVLTNSTICIYVPEDSVMYHLLQTLQAAILDSREEQTILIKRFLEDLVYLIGKEASVSYADDDRLNKVINHIHEHYSDRLTNACLSRLVGLETCYFSRLFKKTFGVTPQRYISDYRLARAEAFLTQRLSVEEIAGKVGYRDAKAFSRFFKKKRGFSPTEFRIGHHWQP